MSKKQTKTNKNSAPHKRTRKHLTQSNSEPDSAYFLKLVMYFVIGTFWVHISTNSWLAPLPVGVVLGAVFASHEHFRIDRKIEYAVLVVAMFLSYFISPKLIIQL